ncbi:GDYXXLXY domain-containing protein [bacterium BD-1]|nr:GDYXXLXY domain-containing protein [Ottowia caeni]
MSTQPEWLRRAQSQGWLSDAWKPVGDAEPSPLLAALVLLGALGCSVPLLGFLGGTFEEALFRTSLGYVVGVLSMAGALWVLRSAHHIFATCLALELLGMGLALVVLRWLDDSGGGDAAALAASVFVIAVLLASAITISEFWVVRLTGFLLAPAVLVGLALGLKLLGLSASRAMAVSPAWLALAAAPWAWWCWREARWLGKPRAARQAALAAGYVASLLVLAVGVGGWMHTPTSLASPAGVNELWSGAHAWPRWLSVWLVLVSGWALMRRWRENGRPHDSVRTLLWLACALLAVCSWFSPVLGVVTLVAALAAASARWRLFAGCGLVTLGLLSAFYYNLAWPLAAKGLGLALLGAVLALCVLVTNPRGRSAASATVPGSRRGAAWILLGGLIALGIANADVWRKEVVIAQGQRILVSLVPVDPRSLMQGDYMQLRFDIPSRVREELDRFSSNSIQWSKRAVVVAKLSDRGQAQLLRLAGRDEPLNPGEILLPLKQLKGEWVLVTDAYFFPEGQGERFVSAKFGEFRVLPDGRALLVGLADAQGRSIAASASLNLERPH